MCPNCSFCGTPVDILAGTHGTTECLEALRRQLAEAKEDAEMSDGCLAMIAGRLEALDCGCGVDHGATPPMFYDDWISCVVAHHVKAAKERAEKAEAGCAEMKAFIDAIHLEVTRTGSSDICAAFVRQAGNNHLPRWDREPNPGQHLFDELAHMRKVIEHHELTIKEQADELATLRKGFDAAASTAVQLAKAHGEENARLRETAEDMRAELAARLVIPPVGKGDWYCSYCKTWASSSSITHAENCLLAKDGAK